MQLNCPDTANCLLPRYDENISPWSSRTGKNGTAFVFEQNASGFEDGPCKPVLIEFVGQSITFLQFGRLHEYVGHLLTFASDLCSTINVLRNEFFFAIFFGDI
jgi:hypothetical protein